MFEDQRNQRFRVDAAHVAETASLPGRGTTREDFGQFMGEMSLRHRGMRLSPEATSHLFRDVDPETLAKLTPDHVRRIAFNASMFAEWEVRMGSPLATEGVAVLTQRFALNMLKQAVAFKDTSTA